jgi:hypothetical protein
MKKLYFFYINLIFFITINFSFAISSNNIIPQKLYDDLLTLRSFNLINTEITGIKPYTKIEFSRLILESYTNAQNKEETFYVLPIIYSNMEKFKSEFEDLNTDSPRLFRLKSPSDSSISYFYFYDQKRQIQSNYSNAFIQPIINYQDGKNYVGGNNLDIDLTNELSIYKYFNIFFSPRVEFLFPRDEFDNNNFNFQVMKLYGKFSMHNIELLIGRDNLIWGQGGRGSLILSNNARPMGELKYFPMFKISNPLPINLPGFFKHIGLLKYAFFITSLEKDRVDYSNPFLTGLKFSFLPHKNFEWGFSHVFMAGGKNGPDFSFFDLFKYYLFISREDDSIKASENYSINRLLGLDAKIRIPYLRYSEIFSEVVFDDFNRITTSFHDSFNYYGGINIPRLLNTGTLQFTSEYTYTSRYLYQSKIFKGGYTHNNRFLGTAIGPNAREVYLKLTHKLSELQAQSISFDSIIRKPLDYLTTNNTSVLDEKRYGILWNYDFYLTHHSYIGLIFGYERINNFDNNEINKNAFLGGLTINFMGTDLR